MEGSVLKIPYRGGDLSATESLLSREWLVTNGLGGYASGTIAGAATRRYHSLLIAALAAPLGRRVMLNHLMEMVRLPDGQTFLLGGEELVSEGLRVPGGELLQEYRLERGLPVWSYKLPGFVLEKRIYLPYRQNTVHVQYKLISGEGSLRLKLLPSVHFRRHEAPVNEPHDAPYSISAENDRYQVRSSTPELPPLRMYIDGESTAFTFQQKDLELFYRVEDSRGYEPRGSLWSPGYFRADISTSAPVTLVASTESWDTISAMSPAEAFAAELERRDKLIAAAKIANNDELTTALVLAADQFLISPVGRVQDTARARASGEEIRSVIAGYHWFTDWGRDTMISLEGLTLATGRVPEARWILRTFALYTREGLLPNLFPEGENEGLYHTADATLWFFHTLNRYVQVTNDRATLTELLPKLAEVVDFHRKGTLFGIGVDPLDGLLRQGQKGYQLTWMDAKVGDWVVTPRRGKAVEINALWFNALSLMAKWADEEPGWGDAAYYRDMAALARESFNKKFWYADGQYLYDVIEGEDAEVDTALRPNQLFSLSLENAVLDEDRWEAVLNAVRENLLTPYGLRSLAPNHPDYKAKYFGDLRARDAAYHQGTVWGWLIGPFVDAWLRVHPGDLETARGFLEGFKAHMTEACVGSISEVFDAEAPFIPRACIAQAWSVAEVLRCWRLTEPKMES